MDLYRCNKALDAREGLLRYGIYRSGLAALGCSLYVVDGESGFGRDTAELCP